MKLYIITGFIIFILLSLVVPVRAESAAEYYNIGNEYYRQGDYFKAI